MGPLVKRFLSRALSAFLLLTTGSLAHGQASGFNFTLGYAGPLVKGGRSILEPAGVLGLAYQQDLDPRFGVAVDFFYGKGVYPSATARSYELIYSAKYFTSDNDATSFYFGTFFGFQRVQASVSEYVVQNGSGHGTYRRTENTKVQFPLGIRAGVRGGLNGYFGEAFTQVGYAIGNGELYTAESIRENTSPLYITVGFSFLGFGWDHARR